MSLLTEQERNNLRSKGLYLKYRCDRPGCPHPVITAWIDGDNQYCSKDCRDWEVKSGMRKSDNPERIQKQIGKQVRRVSRRDARNIEKLKENLERRMRDTGDAVLSGIAGLKDN